MLKTPALLSTAFAAPSVGPEATGAHADPRVVFVGSNRSDDAALRDLAAARLGVPARALERVAQRQRTLQEETGSAGSKVLEIADFKGALRTEIERLQGTLDDPRARDDDVLAEFREGCRQQAVVTHNGRVVAVFM